MFYSPGGAGIRTLSVLYSNERLAFIRVPLSVAVWMACLYDYNCLFGCYFNGTWLIKAVKMTENINYWYYISHNLQWYV